MDQDTKRLKMRLQQALNAYQFNELLWQCFVNDLDAPSKVRYKTIFGNNDRLTIADCRPEEIKAVSKLSDIPCSELINEYGMGHRKTTLAEANCLVKAEGLELFFAVHAA